MSEKIYTWFWEEREDDNILDYMSFQDIKQRFPDPTRLMCKRRLACKYGLIAKSYRCSKSDYKKNLLSIGKSRLYKIIKNLIFEQNLKDFTINSLIKEYFPNYEELKKDGFKLNKDIQSILDYLVCLRILTRYHKDIEKEIYDNSGKYIETENYRIIVYSYNENHQEEDVCPNLETKKDNNNKITKTFCCLDWYDPNELEFLDEV